MSPDLKEKDLSMPGRAVKEHCMEILKWIQVWHFETLQSA